MGRRSLQVVVKITKHCNLRCRYCYEYNELHQKERMSLEQIRSMFDNLLPYAREQGFDNLQFAWHGGEPFLVPLKYYREIESIQRECFGRFGNQIAPWNTLQSNLTILTDEHLSFLRERTFFAGIGVSFDVFGGERVDTAGRRRDELVAANLEKLKLNGIEHGGICVLARSTLPHIEDVYAYYDMRETPFRFLPFYLSATPSQLNAHAITFDELVEGLKRAFLSWARSENATQVDPIDDYINYAMAFLADEEACYYDKRDDEYVLVLNRDGGVWGVAETYDPAFSYGNLFQQDVGEVLASEGRVRAINAAERRLQEHCARCPFFGACPGHYVGDATPLQEQMLSERGCPVRPVLAFIVGYFEREGFTREAAATRPAMREAGSAGRHSVAV